MIKKAKKQTIMGISLLALLGLSTFPTVTVASENPTSRVDQQRMQRTFTQFNAEDIIKNHNQRIANIESEIRQVTDLINDYARFKNRMGSVRMDARLKADMMRTMEEELDRYWEIHRMLTEVRQVLEARPTVRTQ